MSNRQTPLQKTQALADTAEPVALPLFLLGENTPVSAGCSPPKRRGGATPARTGEGQTVSRG